ncbi:uncharacterized protein DS421_1g15940 [Arachis hypogaea]|nr:uncharacterized protein DS421_1g15940 [Arachis hypogaea]
MSSPSQLTIVVSSAHRRCSPLSQASCAHHRHSHCHLIIYIVAYHRALTSVEEGACGYNDDDKQQ